MSPALRDLERLILEKKLRHGSHPLLNWCASNATIVRSAVGDRKLDKRQATRRVDGLIALTMAIGVAPTAWTAAVDVRALIG
jgi:phage terminase large subunit-like protein